MGRGKARDEALGGESRLSKRPAAATVENDRARAITRAMQEAGPDDVVLVAGKGHETVQIIGTRALPFSDRERVMAVAREWSR